MINHNIDKTILNYELADEMIAKTDAEKIKLTLTEENEAIDKQNGYK